MLSDIAGTPEVITGRRCSVEGRPFEQRFYLNSEVQLTGTTTRNTSKTTALHFPGKAFGLLHFALVLCVECYKITSDMCPVATLSISCSCVCRHFFWWDFTRKQHLSSLSQHFSYKNVFHCLLAVWDYSSSKIGPNNFNRKCHLKVAKLKSKWLLILGNQTFNNPALGSSAFRFG